VGLEYRIGNRRVTKAQWERHLQQQVVEAASDAVEKRVRSVRCPIHNERPTRVTATRSGTDVKWRIEGCCDDLIAAVQRSLQ
jgi:hypothetical protein